MKKVLLVAKWFFGITYILIGIEAFGDSILKAVLAILLGLFITPLTLQFFEKTAKITIPRLYKWAIAVGGCLVFAFLMNSINTAKDKNARVLLSEAIEQINSGDIKGASVSLKAIEANSTSLKDSIADLITLINKAQSNEYAIEVLGSMTDDEFAKFEKGQLTKEYISYPVLNRSFMTLMASNKEKKREMMKMIADAEIRKAENEKIAKARLAGAVKKLRTTYDDIQETTWYYSKSTTRYRNENSFHIYMGKSKEGNPWLRFVIQYAGDDWLFIQKYIIKTDNNTYTIEPSIGEIEKDNDTDVWEWYDTKMDANKLDIIRDMINSKSVKLRMEGKQYYKDRIISKQEIQNIKNVLEAYEVFSDSKQL
jgi:hypothetical protein